MLSGSNPDIAEIKHQRIGFIHGPYNHTSSGRRFEGFCAAIEESGGAVLSELVAPGMFTYRSGLSAAESLLSLPVWETSLFPEECA